MTEQPTETELQQALTRMRQALIHDWLNTPLYALDDDTPAQAIEAGDERRVSDYIASLIRVNLEKPLNHTLDEFSEIFLRSWLDQLSGFLDKTPREALRAGRSQEVVALIDREVEFLRSNLRNAQED